MDAATPPPELDAEDQPKTESLKERTGRLREQQRELDVQYAREERSPAGRKSYDRARSPSRGEQSRELSTEVMPKIPIRLQHMPTKLESRDPEDSQSENIGQGFDPKAEELDGHEISLRLLPTRDVHQYARPVNPVEGEVGVKPQYAQLGDDDDFDQHQHSASSTVPGVAIIEPPTPAPITAESHHPSPT